MKHTTTCLLILLTLYSCSNKQKEPAKEPTKVDIIQVGSQADNDTCGFVGTVDANAGTILSFESGGKITRLTAREGDRVRKGQLLGTVSPTTLHDSHYATQVTLAQAQDAYKRMKQLHAQGVISDIKWVEVETKLHQAESAERIAREQLSHTNLSAPFNGVITSRDGEIGMNVLPDQPVYKLADVSRVDVNFSVPENEISGIAVGSSFLVKVDAAGGRTFNGIVKEKGIVADAVSHTYNVRLTLPNTDGKLLPGMVCKVLHQANKGKGSIIIPMGAVELDTDNTRFVWLERNGKAHRQNIKTGIFSGGGVTVTNGLNGGERLIVGGMQKVSEGMPVRENK